MQSISHMVCGKAKSTRGRRGSIGVERRPITLDIGYWILATFTHWHSHSPYPPLDTARPPPPGRRLSQSATPRYSFSPSPLSLVLPAKNPPIPLTLGIGYWYWQHFHIGSIPIPPTPARHRSTHAAKMAALLSHLHPLALASPPKHWILGIGYWQHFHIGTFPFPLPPLDTARPPPPRRRLS